MSRFEAVLFDFGGTLFSYRSVGLQALELIRRAGERLGVPVDLARLGVAYREAGRASYQLYAPRPFYLHRELFQDTFRRFAEALGATPTQAYLDWHHEEQRRLLLERFELRADCLATLQELRARGLHVGIVSNIDDDYLEPMLERCRLAQVLHAWTSSEEAASCKPHPDIFHHALRKAGTQASRTLFVGDSREHDVAGARSVGMTSVLLREPQAEPPGAGVGESAEPHHEIDALAELLSLVDSREGAS